MLPGFAQFSFEARDQRHPVFHSDNASDPPILLLPEIAGFSPGLSLFAERLVEAGFRIYVPWLFGPFGKRAPARNALRLCVSREFAYLRAGVSAPVTDWLRALSAHISRHNSGARIGALGMCLTGAFVIPLVIDPAVAAVVAAQPAVPMSLWHLASGNGGGQTASALNVDDQDIAEARARLASGQARMLALRCRADRICPQAKIERLRREFPAGLEVREYGAVDDRNALGERPHATFTKEYRLAADASAEHHSRQAFADLISFFRQHLSAREMFSASSG
jgi:dienelactone hydrolase